MFLPIAKISKETHKLLKEIQKKLPAAPPYINILEEAVKLYAKRLEGNPVG